MKRTLAIASLILAATSAHAAVRIEPTQAQLNEALTRAAAAWGVRVEFPIRIEMSDLNPCNRLHNTPVVATIHVAETKTTMRAEDDSAPPVVSVGYAYAIQVNSSCKWDEGKLQAVVTHELGHVLLGAAYHSKDRHSLMFEIVDGAQALQAEDLRLAAAARIGGAE